jgi:pimeloyl-ACP methyl ester carboxylesterase
MKRLTIRQWIRRIWIAFALGTTTVFCLWSLIAYRASAAARAADASNSPVQVTRDGAIRRFVPTTGANPDVGLLFFPGALVDPVAYSPLMRAVAEAGFEAVVVALPRRGAFGGAEAPELHDRINAVMQASRSPHRWIIAGHSRGAVVASQLASSQPAGMAGLVLIGTTHPRDVDLSDLRVLVTKVVGTRDGIARPQAVEANAHLLPASTRWVRIEGGNHSQFGWYGFQPGDRFARINATEQRKLMIEAVLDALRAAVGDSVSPG